MKKNPKIKSKNKIIGFIVIIASFVFIQYSYQTQVLALSGASTACDKYFLNIPSWFNGLRGGPGCSIITPGSGGVSMQNFISEIIVNISSILSNLFFYICVIYTMYGGYQIIIGGNNPDAIKKGRSTIFNGIIGGVIGLGAGPIVKSLSGIVNPKGNEFDLLTSLLGFATVTATYVTVLMIVLSGIAFITSSGNPDNIQKARRRLIYAVIGLVIVVSTGAISNFVRGSGVRLIPKQNCGNNCQAKAILRLSATNARCDNNGGYNVSVEFNIKNTSTGSSVNATSKTSEIKCSGTVQHKPANSKKAKAYNVFTGRLYFSVDFNNLKSDSYKVCFYSGGKLLTSKCKDISLSTDETVRLYATEDQDGVNLLSKPLNW